MAQSDADAVVKALDEVLSRLQPPTTSVMDAALAIYLEAVWTAMMQSDVQHWPRMLESAGRQLECLQTNVRRLMEVTLVGSLRKAAERSVAN